MDLTINSSMQQFLFNLQGTENQLQKAQLQVSSGLQMQLPSDDPAAISTIYQLQSTLAQNQQVQNNLATVNAQVTTADGALQSAVSLVQNAFALAAQGANSTATAEDRANIAQQVAGLQQSLVSIAQTSVDGRYIFSGDQSSQAPYRLDPTQPEGVQQLVFSSSTIVVQDVNGASIAVGKTAQQIFDARDSGGNPASGNVFAAINSLLVALQSNDQAGITQSSDALQSAGNYLNDQLAFYGEAENQVQSATDLAQKYQIQENSQLSNVQAANIPAAALQLSHSQIQEQATLSAESMIEQQKHLFSYLG